MCSSTRNVFENVQMILAAWEKILLDRRFSSGCKTRRVSTSLNKSKGVSPNPVQSEFIRT